MPRFKRYQHRGQYMQNTMTITTLDYIGAGHAYLEMFPDAVIPEHYGNLCAEFPAEFDPRISDVVAQRKLICEHEEREASERNKADYAIAFNIPVEEIEVEFSAWDGDDAKLPYASDNSAPVVRIPEEQRPGYVKPAPAPPSRDEVLAGLFATIGDDPALSKATKTAITAAVDVLKG